MLIMTKLNCYMCWWLDEKHTIYSNIHIAIVRMIHFIIVIEITRCNIHIVISLQGVGRESSRNIIVKCMWAIVLITIIVGYDTYSVLQSVKCAPCKCWNGILEKFTQAIKKFVKCLDLPIVHATPLFDRRQAPLLAYFQTDMCDEKDTCAIGCNFDNWRMFLSIL